MILNSPRATIPTSETTDFDLQNRKALREPSDYLVCLHLGLNERRPSIAVLDISIRPFLDEKPSGAAATAATTLSRLRPATYSTRDFIMSA